MFLVRGGGRQFAHQIAHKISTTARLPEMHIRSIPLTAVRQPLIIYPLPWRCFNTHRVSLAYRPVRDAPAPTTCRLAGIAKDD